MTLSRHMLALVFFVCAFSSSAHEARPLNVSISEIEQELVRLHWIAPSSVGRANAPFLTINGCENVNKNSDKPETSLNGMDLYSCQGGLQEKSLAILWPNYNPSISAMVKLSFESGEKHSTLLGPSKLNWTIPKAETFWGVAADYILLGGKHIFAGVDHLLFLACLIWISGTFRRVLITVTGFTLAHSITLILSALDIFQLPVPPTEAAIALSILFLVREILVCQKQTFTWRYPIVVSSSFGLLHGLGFAAALAETGLPQTQLAVGLIGFNLGVEIGQVLFVIAFFAGMSAFQHLASEKISIRAELIARNLATSVIGITSGYWFIERTISFAL